MISKELRKERLENVKMWIESCEWWMDETVKDIKKGWKSEAKLDYKRAQTRLVWAKENINKITERSSE